MHRSDFCVTACFRDVFLFRALFLIRQLLLLVVVSMALFEASRLTGVIRIHPFPLLGPPSLVNLIGDFVFGIGMVLAGGCVRGSLYKLGAGSARSLLAVMLAGSALYAERHPQWGAFAKACHHGQPRARARRHRRHPVPAAAGHRRRGAVFPLAPGGMALVPAPAAVDLHPGRRPAPGAGARMAPSCNVWHLWGGVPVLAMASLLFLLACFPAAGSACACLRDM